MKAVALSLNFSTFYTSTEQKFNMKSKIIYHLGLSTGNLRVLYEKFDIALKILISTPKDVRRIL